MEFTTESKGELLRSFCETFTGAFDNDDEKAVTIMTQGIVDIMNNLTKEEQQEIFNRDKDLLEFINNFASFRSLIK